MKMNDSAGWSALLAESIRPYKGELAVVRSLAADPPPNDAHVAIAGLEEAVAALVALRGPGEYKNFFPTIQPLLTKIGRKLSMFPESIDAVSMTTLFCLSMFSEAMATPLSLPEYDVDERLKSVTSYRDASKLGKVTAILICLSYGRLDEARYLPAGIDAATASLIKQLAAGLKSGSSSKDVEAAWDAYLRAFPQALQNEAAEWRHLLLAARLALGKLGGVPAGQVAESLHERIKKLAAEESA